MYREVLQSIYTQGFVDRPTNVTMKICETILYGTRHLKLWLDKFDIEKD